ncbi:MAG: YceI family protein, partial [Pseudomonadota bacterium]
MKSTVRNTLAAASLLFAINAQADHLAEMPSGDYVLDKTHAYLTFSYSHLGFSSPQVGFRSFDANLMLDNENVENSSVEVVIDTASIDSRLDEFNDHLNGKNFFDTANFPKATFKSTGVKAMSDEKLMITGDLTVKDVTKPVVLNATLNKAAMHPMRKVQALGFSAQTKIKR